MKELTIWQFLELAEEGEWSDLEIVNFIEKVTDKFEIHKLKLLLNEVDFYLFDSKEQYYADNRERVMKEFIEEGKEFPYLTLKKPEKGANPAAFKFYEDFKDKKVIDDEILFGTEMQIHFYPIYKIKGFINFKIKELTKLDSSNDLVESAPEKYTMVNYALMHVYLSKFDKSEIVRSSKCEEIARRYGFNSKYSGQQFLQKFNEESVDYQRTEFLGDSIRKDRATLKKLLNTIELLEEKHPNSEALKFAKDEFEAYELKFKQKYNN